MPNNTIELIIKATDQASAQIKGIAEQLDVVGKAADAAKEAFAGLAVGFTLDKLVDSITEAETATNDLNRAYATFGSTVGVSRDQMDGFADSVSKATTLSSGSLKEAQAVLLSYGATAGASFSQARDLVVDLAAKMGVDAAQAAELLGRALQNPVSGIRLLSEVGVTLTQSQRATIASLEETGDAAQAAAFIMQTLSDRVKGAAADLNNTLGGALTNLKNSFESAFEGQGADVSTLTNAIHELSGEVQDPRFQAAIQAIVGGIIALSGAAVDAVASVNELFAGPQDVIGKLTEERESLEQLIALPEQDPTAIQDYVIQLASVEKQLNDLKAAADAADKALPNFGVTGDNFDDDKKSKASLFNPLEFGITAGSQGAKQSNPNSVDRLAPPTDRTYQNPFLPASLVDQYLSDTESNLDKAYDTLSQHINERAQLVAAGQLDATKAFYENANDQQTYQDAIDKTLAPVTTSAQHLKDPLTDIEKYGQQVASTLTSSFESFFESGDLSAKNFAKTMITALEQILAKAVSIDLVNALGLNKLFATASDNSGGSGAVTSGLFGAIGAAFTGHAGGGQIFGPSIVGENGPELFIPGTSGTIMNAQQAMFAGGGSSPLTYAPVTTINLTADDSSKTAGTLMQYFTYQQQEQKKDLLRTLARNGYKVR